MKGGSIISRIFLFGFILLSQVPSFGQCSFDDLDLEGTGTINQTLSGNCTLAANDGTEGTILRIQGDVTIDGAFTMSINATIVQIIIESGGSLTIASGTTIDFTGTPRDIFIQGNLNINGTLNMTQGSFQNDVEVDGGSVIVGSTGSFDVGDDLHVYNDGYFEIAAGGSVDVSDSIWNDATAGGGGGGDDGAATFVINGSLNADDITIFDTAPANASSISGTGDITVTTSIIYDETPALDFSDCATGGTCGGTGEALPVELVFFNTGVKGSTVYISWRTATEINNDFFTLERSQDEINWLPISTISGNGNANTVHNYTYTDTNPFLGQSFYRLKQTDFDGSFEYFDPVQINFTGQASFLIQPNPSHDILNVYNSDIEHAVLTVISISGQEMNVPIINSQTNQVTFDVSGLKRGLYILRIFKTGKLTSQRFVKL